MIWNSYPKPYVVFIAKPSTYATCCLIELCQIVATLSEIHFILPCSRSRTCFHHMLCFYTRSKQISIHPQNKTPCPCMTPLSLKNTSRIWGYVKRKLKMHTQRRYATCFGMSKKKRIKDGYRKKVCLMLRHVKKKEKKEKTALIQKERKIERWCIQRSSYTIHKKYPHTCTFWTRFMTCFSFGSGLWLSKIWKAGMPSILHTYSSTKISIRDRLRKKGTIKSLGKELYTLSDPRDHPRNLMIFLLKNFTKPPGWRLS